MAKGLNLTGLGFEVPAPPADQGAPMDIPLDEIALDPNQPRKRIDPDKLKELADSIRESGVHTPISVSKTPEGKYLLQMGERRYRASKLAGMKTIPAFCRNADIYEQVTENIQREDLSPMEIAQFIAGRIAAGEKQSQIAKKLGVRADFVSVHVGLAKSPEFVQELSWSKKVGARTLYELAQAHKEFPGEVEAFAKSGEDVTRAGLTALLARLRSKVSPESEKPTKPVEPSHNQATSEAEKTQAALEAPEKASEHQAQEQPPQPIPKPAEPEVKEPAAPKPATAEVPKREIRVVIDGRPAVLANAAEVMVIFTDTGEQQTVQLSAIDAIEVTTNEST